ncbi:MAG: hypothetical protein JWO13_2376 [Acidobacteriales bacterium]|nr:hypothetical protein [Terriglobales bacterium]
MKRPPFVILIVLLSIVALCAAAKPKVITFGRWTPVKWYVGSDETTPVELKVRALAVNGDTKEFTTGEPHDVTDRAFVVRRAYRLNDTLPEDEKLSAKWKWQPGGWLMIDRSTAHISKLTLPEYDPFYSTASWYRDLAAYCGVSDGGDKVFAVVVQVGRKKPLLHKLLGAAKAGELPESECTIPLWQRQPVRVTFQPIGGEKISFSVRGHAVEIAPDNSEDE